MHAASLSSPRLVRVLKLLSDGRAHSTREIARRAHVCAINSCVAELRAHGAEIHCERLRVKDEWRFFYTMTKKPDEVGGGDADG